MGPQDRPLRGRRATSLIFWAFAQTQSRRREFLVHRFNRIDVLGRTQQWTVWSRQSEAAAFGDRLPHPKGPA